MFSANNNIYIIKFSEDYFIFFNDSPKYLKIDNKIAYIYLLILEKPCDASYIHQQMSKKINISFEEIGIIISTMLEYKIIIEEQEKITTSCTKNELLISEYSKYSWQSAIAYHLQNFDYQFVNYTSADGYLEDKDRMKRYALEKKDDEYYKAYQNSKKIYCNIPRKVDFSSSGLSKENILKILSIVLGFDLGREKNIGKRPRKTIPSGGGRHPVEAYLLVDNIEELENSSIYHFNAMDYCLEQMKMKLNKQDIDHFYFSDEEYIGFVPKMTILLTTVFERNMYRYRETRTFRTVHMDSGHALAALKNLCKTLNINVKIQFNCNEKYLMNFMHINPLEEGFMSALHIG